MRFKAGSGLVSGCLKVAQDWFQGRFLGWSCVGLGWDWALETRRSRDQRTKRPGRDQETRGTRRPRD